MEQTSIPSYFSAEFRLENPGIFYQFRVRKSKNEPMFALVRKDSKALECIRAGDRIPMIYHFPDKTIPGEIKETKIKYIVDGDQVGCKDHFFIALEIDGVK